MIEDRIRASFQNGISMPPEGFEERNDLLLATLKSNKTQHSVFFRKRLALAFTIVAIMLLGIGLAATSNHWGVLDWLAENRPQTLPTNLPLAVDESVPALAPFDTEYVTITVREAMNDGYGLYLSVVFTPEDKYTLAFNSSINPFMDGPEVLGLVADHKNQTLADWAVNHGYNKLLRVAVLSMPSPSIPKGMNDVDDIAEYMEKQGTTFRRTSTGGIQYDRVSAGQNFDSYLNNQSILEEDGSTLIMVAGSCINGQEDYQMLWTAVPCLMNENGTWENNVPEWRTDDWSQGTISVHIPRDKTIDSAIIAEYAGTLEYTDHSDTSCPVTVQLIRTELNDYYQIKCADSKRSFQAPHLYLEDGISRFTHSDIYSSSAQETDGVLVFTSAGIFPKEIPDRLIIRWFDLAYYVEDTIVERAN